MNAEWFHPPTHPHVVHVTNIRYWCLGLSPQIASLIGISQLFPSSPVKKQSCSFSETHSTFVHVSWKLTVECKRIHFQNEVIQLCSNVGNVGSAHFQDRIERTPLLKWIFQTHANFDRRSNTKGSYQYLVNEWKLYIYIWNKFVLRQDRMYGISLYRTAIVTNGIIDF